MSQPHLCLLGDANSVHLQRWAREMVARGWRVSVVTARPQPIDGVEPCVLSPVRRSLDWLRRVGEARRCVDRLLDRCRVNRLGISHLAEIGNHETFRRHLVGGAQTKERHHEQHERRAEKGRMHETKVRAAHRRVQIPTLTFRTPFTGQSEFLPFIFRACYNLHMAAPAW